MAITAGTIVMWLQMKNCKNIRHASSARFFSILIVFFIYSQTILANAIYPDFLDEFNKTPCPENSYFNSGVRDSENFSGIWKLHEKLKNAKPNDRSKLEKKIDQEVAKIRKKLVLNKACGEIFRAYESFIDVASRNQQVEKFYDLIQQVELANNTNALGGRFNNILNAMKEKLIERHGRRQAVNLRGESLGTKGAIISYHLFLDEKVLFERAFSYNGNNLEKKETEYRLVEEPYSGDKKYIRFIMPGSEINNARKICDKDIPVFKAAGHDSGWSGFEFGGIRENTKYYLKTSEYVREYGANYPVIIANTYEILKDSYNLSDEPPSANIDFCAEPAQLDSLSVSRSSDLESHADLTYSSDGCEEGRDMYVHAKNLVLRSEPVKDKDSELWYNQNERAKVFQFSKCDKVSVIEEDIDQLEEKENIEWMKISNQCVLKHISGNISGSAKFEYKSGELYEKEFMHVAYRDKGNGQFFLKKAKPDDCSQ